MNEFNEQLKNNQNKYITEFNTNPKYDKIRNLYKVNFELITKLIHKSNAKLAIEDISKIDGSLSNEIIANRLLLKEINGAILKQEFTLKDIK